MSASKALITNGPAPLRQQTFPRNNSALTKATLDTIVIVGCFRESFPSVARASGPSPVCNRHNVSSFTRSVRTPGVLKEGIRMSERLPAKPDLTYLKRQGKKLLLGVRSRDPTALSRVRKNLPGQRQRTLNGRKETFGLTDALLVIAREYGFPSWTKLKAGIADGVHLTINQSLQASPLEGFEGISTSETGESLTEGTKMASRKVLDIGR